MNLKEIKDAHNIFQLEEQVKEFIKKKYPKVKVESVTENGASCFKFTGPEDNIKALSEFVEIEPLDANTLMYEYGYESEIYPEVEEQFVL